MKRGCFTANKNGKKRNTMMETYDIAIIGTGPAGISAAITATIRNKKIILFGSRELSDKIRKAHLIQNYPGFPECCKPPIFTQTLSIFFR